MTLFAPFGCAMRRIVKLAINGTHKSAKMPATVSRSAMRPVASVVRHMMSTIAPTIVDTRSPEAPYCHADTTTPTLATSSGIEGTRRRAPSRAFATSRVAMTTAMATTGVNRAGST